MSDAQARRRVAVDELCLGLYVAEPDRPWTELPTRFQGFEIAAQEQIELLQAHCEHVYVDPDRSNAGALADVGAGAGAAPTAAPGAGTDTAAAFGDARQPDPAKFTRLVQTAYQSRDQTRRYLEAVLTEVADGGRPDAARSGAMVAELAYSVGSDPAAALWLANLEDRDSPTSVHSVNVCVLALAFGLHLGLERRELREIGLGALLHDVGKVFLPWEILSKPEALTAAETALVRRHPEDGYERLAEAGGFPEAALDIVRHHHERLDGSGYPHGRAGLDVALGVRLVGLVNTYDALTSARPYRRPLPADQALQQLYNAADATFGAPLVQEFIRCVGIYPVGSLVELDNGAAALVLGSRPDSRIQPTVLLLRTPDGEAYRKRVVLNLAAEAESEGRAPARHIRCALDATHEGIDVAAIVALEFGLDAFG